MGEGEAEAIALAIELRADLLLIDERLGRIVAARNEVEIIGVMGVLVQARRLGLIPSVKPILDDLIAAAGFWVSGPLYRRVLESVGES